VPKIKPSSKDSALIGIVIIGFSPCPLDLRPAGLGFVRTINRALIRIAFASETRVACAFQKWS
jgi:hypothetical protein